MLGCGEVVEFMKKRLMFVLIFGISFAPAVFADEAKSSSLFNDSQLADKTAAYVAKPGQMDPRREVYFCKGDGLFHYKLAPQNGTGSNHDGRAERAISANQ